MANYKLTYFDLRGRAEPLRLLFAFAKVKFEDIRIKGEEWPAYKPKTPWGQMPVLEVEGRTIAQTGTIAKFLARRFNLQGQNEWEVSKAEEIVDSAHDFATEVMIKYVFESDAAKKEAQKKNLLENIVPKYYGKYEQIQAKNGGPWMVGNSVTWADVWVANFLDNIDNVLGPDLIKPYPNLQKVKDAFFALPQIKEYVSTRE